MKERMEQESILGGKNADGGRSNEGSLYQSCTCCSFRAGVPWVSLCNREDMP